MRASRADQVSVDSESTCSYDSDSKVGSGSFASVYVNESGNVVKRYVDDVDHALLEINVLNVLKGLPDSSRNRFPRMLSFDIHYRAKKVSIEMSHCGIDLGDVIRSDAFRHVKESTKMFIFRELLLALDAMHAAGFAHGDVKPNNIMVSIDSSDLTKKKINAALLACAVRVVDFNKCEPLGMRFKSTSKCNLHYCPPEIILGNREYDNSIDTWSAMCVLGEMLLGRNLWNVFNTPDSGAAVGHVRGNSPGSSPASTSAYSSDSDFSYSGDRPSELALLHLFDKVLGPNTHIEGRFSRELYPGGRLMGTLRHNSPAIGVAALGIPSKFLEMFARVFRYNPRDRASIADLLAGPAI